MLCGGITRLQELFARAPITTGVVVGYLLDETYKDTDLRKSVLRYRDHCVLTQLEEAATSADADVYLANYRDGDGINKGVMFHVDKLVDTSGVEPFKGLEFNVPNGDFLLSRRDFPKFEPSDDSEEVSQPYF